MAPKKAVVSQANSKDRSRSRGAVTDHRKACPKPKAEPKAKAKAKAAAAKALAESKVPQMVAGHTYPEEKRPAFQPRGVASESQDLLLLREALATSRAQLEAAQANAKAAASRAEALERRFESSGQLAAAAEKRAAHAEGKAEVLVRQAEELRQRAAKGDEAELRAARAEGRLESLQEMREDMPGTVRSIVEAFVVASGRRAGRGGASSNSNGRGFLGAAKVKLEIEDSGIHATGGVLPLADVESPGAQDEGAAVASPAEEGQLLEFYKVDNTIGGDIASPVAPPVPSSMRRLGGIASVLQAATNLGRSGSRRSCAA